MIPELSPDALDWPGVAEHGIARVPPEHLVAGWYVLLAVVAVAVLIVARRAIMALLGAASPHASLSAEQIEDAVAAGVARTINGSLDRMERQIAELGKLVQGNRAIADQRHEQNISRLTALEASARMRR